LSDPGRRATLMVCLAVARRGSGGPRMEKSVITRVYVPTHVRTGPDGERVIVPGHYRALDRRR